MSMSLVEVAVYLLFHYVYMTMYCNVEKYFFLSSYTLKTVKIDMYV